MAGFPHSEIPGSQLGYQLPWAYRRFLRPSSPLDAKTSTVCPYSTWSHRPDPDTLPFVLFCNSTNASEPRSDLRFQVGGIYAHQLQLIEDFLSFLACALPEIPSSLRRSRQSHPQTLVCYVSVFTCICVTNSVHGLKRCGFTAARNATRMTCQRAMPSNLRSLALARHLNGSSGTRKDTFLFQFVNSTTTVSFQPSGATPAGRRFQPTISPFLPCFLGCFLRTRPR